MAGFDAYTSTSRDWNPTWWRLSDPPPIYLMSDCLKMVRVNAELVATEVINGRSARQVPIVVCHPRHPVHQQGAALTLDLPVAPLN